MKYIVAVSGGVDSVVLLDMLAKSDEHELIVAHFDHGIRQDSAADARFVEALAARYGLEFVQRREELGKSASEQLARDRRYRFLFNLAQDHGAKIATAHHLDDLVETIGLNLARGARWRGLATMSDERIYRPLTKRTKSELIQYAVERELEWVEDETNQTSVYRRNRIRQLLSPLLYEQKIKIYKLWQKQLALKKEIEQEIAQEEFTISSRYFMTMLPHEVAIELIYEYALREMGVSLLTAQAERLWLALKVGQSGTIWQIGSGVSIKLTTRDAIIYIS